MITKKAKIMKERKPQRALLFAFILLFQIPNTGRTDAHADDLQTDEEKMLVISDANAYILKNTV